MSQSCKARHLLQMLFRTPVSTPFIVRMASAGHGGHGPSDAAEDANCHLKLSDACVKQLKVVCSGCHGNQMLRVVVEGGGCSGFQYKFQLDKQVHEDDRVCERDNARVVIDMDSLEYVKGSTVDFQQELIRSAFCIVDNPLAETSCSCGASFNFRL